MKLAFPNVVANEPLRRRLQDDLLRDKLSHAYIIEGPTGSGKHLLALQLAAALSCENRRMQDLPLPCSVCPSCKKILGKYSTDVIFKNRGDKATLGVEVIRDLRQDVYIPPNDNATKVYIIEEAHLMTVQAQNAFLLTLEEPPAYVLFLLLCENASRLLETVRSRAPVLRTEPIAPQEIGHYLCTTNAEAKKLRESATQEFDEILASADGSIGRAIALLDSKRRRPILQKRQLARDFVTLCTGRKESGAAIQYLNRLGQKREEIAEQMGTTLLCLRDLLLCKQTENAPLCFFADREEACALAYHFTTPELLMLCEHVQNVIDRLQANANVRLTLTAFASGVGLL